MKNIKIEEINLFTIDHATYLGVGTDLKDDGIEIIGVKALHLSPVSYSNNIDFGMYLEAYNMNELQKVKSTSPYTVQSLDENQIIEFKRQIQLFLRAKREAIARLEISTYKNLRGGQQQ